MSRGDKQGTSRSKTISHHFKQVVTRTRVSPGFEFYFFMYDAFLYDAFPYDALVYDAFPYDAFVYDAFPYDAFVYDTFPYDAFLYDAFLYDAFPYTMPLRILMLFAFSSFLLVKFDLLNV